jgi:hypothetical protein
MDGARELGAVRELKSIAHAVLAPFGCKAMKIRMDVDGARITGTLDDNATSKDFASLLPLTLTLDDYNGTEKISDLPKKLSTRGAPEGVDPAAGDIAYYAPWGNLAIFYKDFEYSRGLVKLGTIESSARVFERPGRLRVTIESIEE